MPCTWLVERGQSLLSRSNSSSRKAGRQDRGLSLQNGSSATALPTHAIDASPSPASAFLGPRSSSGRTNPPTTPGPNNYTNKVASAFRVRSIRNAASPTSLTSSLPTINRRISDDDVGRSAQQPARPVRRNKLVRDPRNTCHMPRNRRSHAAQSMDFDRSQSMDFNHRPHSQRHSFISHIFTCCSPISLFRRGPTYGSVRDDARQQSPEEQQQPSAAASAAVEERLLPSREEMEEADRGHLGERHIHTQAQAQAQGRLSATDTAVGAESSEGRSASSSKVSSTREGALLAGGDISEDPNEGDWLMSRSDRGLVDYEDYTSSSPVSGISSRNAAAVNAAAAAISSAPQASEPGAYNNSAYSDFDTDTGISSPGNSEYRTPPTSVGDLTDSSVSARRDNVQQDKRASGLVHGALSQAPANAISKIYLEDESYEHVSRKLTLETSSVEPESINDEDYDSEEDIGLRTEIASPPGNVATESSERLVTHVSSQYLLPPLARKHKGRKCLVLDLDETLVHSSFREVEQPDYIVPVVLEGQEHSVYVVKRPGVDEFMRVMGQYYEIVVFTASLSMYADPVLDLLDKFQVVHHRLFRESCNLYNGNYVKDLSRLGRDVGHSIIIDNSPASYAFHPSNAIGISTWLNDPMDTELRDLIPFLIDLTTVDDVSAVLSLTHNHTSFVHE
ncbi:hypothetical protein BX070DRAFT_232378 [Coemansia spiralis]|nr:hypothetical protein BX070DRAFT_232378 [Coemansia spiralis]